jgi:hypothetical protein
VQRRHWFSPYTLNDTHFEAVRNFFKEWKKIPLPLFRFLRGPRTDSTAAAPDPPFPRIPAHPHGRGGRDRQPFEPKRPAAVDAAPAPRHGGRFRRRQRRACFVAVGARKKRENARSVAEQRARMTSSLWLSLLSI